MKQKNRERWFLLSLPNYQNTTFSGRQTEIMMPTKGLVFFFKKTNGFAYETNES